MVAGGGDGVFIEGLGSGGADDGNGLDEGGDETDGLELFIPD